MTRLSDHLHCQDMNTNTGATTDLFDTFITILKGKIHRQLLLKLRIGETTLSELYEKLGHPVMLKRYCRQDMPYNLLHLLSDAVRNGKLVISDSSWGDLEAMDEKKQNTKPGADDLFPESYGFGNIGGPTCRMRVTKECIHLVLNIVNRDAQSSPKNMDKAWETREFTFKNPEGNLSEENLNLLKDWIVSHEVDKCVNYKLDKFMCSLADRFLDEDFNNIINQIP